MISPNFNSHTVLGRVSWAQYAGFIKELDQRPIRLTFDNGRLEITPPRLIPQRWKCRLRRMIDVSAEERQIEIESLGSTTFAREDLQKALEPDECFYVAHADDIRERPDIDLQGDPPPDLAIDIDIPQPSIPREPIYAALGVPELWRFDGLKLHVLKLGSDKTYVLTAKSNVFPFLRMDEFTKFILRMDREPQLSVLGEFRTWLRSLKTAT